MILLCPRLGESGAHAPHRYPSLPQVAVISGVHGPCVSLFSSSLIYVVPLYAEAVQSSLTSSFGGIAVYVCVNSGICRRKVRFKSLPVMQS